MPSAIWRPFEERFGVDILEWYGTMEGGFAYNPVGQGPIGSFGKPPLGLMEMNIVDEADNAVPVGTIGELVVRPAGQPATLNYYKNPEAATRKTRGGWLHTGDMCWRDAEGWFYFAHRQEEGGIRKLGEFISEGFIRRTLAEDPHVLDVHIYGVPAQNGAPGEQDIVAAIVLQLQEHFDVRTLFTRCQRQLERSHVPDYIQVVAELPKTSSAKVQVRLLLEAFTAIPSQVFARKEGGELRKRNEWKQEEKHS